MAWYDRVLAYLSYKKEGKWSTKLLRFRNMAEKSRAEGIAKNDSELKETAFMSAVCSYEQVVAEYHPPKVIAFLKKFRTQRRELKEHKLNMEDKHSKFLKQVDTALKPVNSVGTRIRLGVDKLAAPYRISIEGDVTFDRKLVLGLRRLTRKQGFLSAVINLFPVLSEVGSREAEQNKDKIKTGRFIINEKKRYLSVLYLLNNLNHYSMSEHAPRSIVRRLKPIVQPPETASKATKEEKAA